MTEAHHNHGERAITPHIQGALYDALLGNGWREAKRIAGNRRVRCPLHDDQTPSFDVHETKLTWLCRAGCGGGGAFDLAVRMRGRAEAGALLDAIRAHEAQGYNGDETPKRVSQPNGTIADTYDYRWIDGVLLYQVCRMEPKGFRQRRPDGNGGWLWNMKGTPTILYKLPELAAALEASDTIWIAEGERDVDALHAAGVVATCNTGGAGKWRDELSEPFAQMTGERILIVQDKDTPGRAHARSVMRSLSKVVPHSVRIEIVEAREGKDAADHFATGHTVDEFVPVELELDPDEPERDEPERDELAEHLSRASASTAAWWPENGTPIVPPPRTYIVQDLVPSGVPALLLARGGTGKGFFQILLAVSVASGLDFGRFSIRKPRGVVIVSREDDRLEIQRRYAATLAALFPGGAPESIRYDLTRNLFVADLLGVPEARLGAPLVDGVCRLTDQLSDPGLVFLDPLGKLLPEDESGTHTLNSQEGAGLVHDWLDRIVRRTGCATFAVHHVTKQSIRDGQPTAGSATGSQLLEDLARIVLALVAVRGEDASKYGVPWHPNGYVEAALLKGNHSPGLAAPFLLRRERGGALVPVDADAPADVEAERCLVALEAAGQPIDRDAWRKLCAELEPPIGKHRADEARSSLFRRGLVVNFMEGRRQLFVPSETAELRDRRRSGGPS